MTGPLKDTNSIWHLLPQSQAALPMLLVFGLQCLLRAGRMCAVSGTWKVPGMYSHLILRRKAVAHRAVCLLRARRSESSEMSSSVGGGGEGGKSESPLDTCV